MPKTNLGTSQTKYKTSKTSIKRVKPMNNKKDLLSRFKPMDDFLLIQGVLQLNDLRSVHLGTKFSCRFTLQEIKIRWSSLMYDETVSALALETMGKLHPELVEKVERNALFSPEEEERLTTITDMHPYVEDFEPLLEEYKHVFHPARTPRDLYNHFRLMKSYNLLPGQTVEPLNGPDELMTFSEAEDQLDDHDLDTIGDSPRETEFDLSNRRNIASIRLLEKEMEQWSDLVTSIRANNDNPVVLNEMDSQTLAIFRGRNMKFVMISSNITFGRNTKDNTVDFDLSLEGSGDKISRRQGSIMLRMNGDFFLSNEGKRTIFVDGEPILRNHKCKLRNQSLVEVTELSFVFLINQDLLNFIRREMAKIDTSVITV